MSPGRSLLAEVVKLPFLGHFFGAPVVVVLVRVASVSLSVAVAVANDGSDSFGLRAVGSANNSRARNAVVLQHCCHCCCCRCCCCFVVAVILVIGLVECYCCC